MNVSKTAGNFEKEKIVKKNMAMSQQTVDK